jgi:hypothetical protein
LNLGKQDEMIKTTTAANNKTIVIKKGGGRKVNLAIQLQYVSRGIVGINCPY